jgi:ribosomal protein L37E
MDNKEVYRKDKAEPRFFYGYIVVAAALLIMLLAYSARLSFGVFFKPMSSELGWSRALTSGAFMLSMLMQGGATIFMGRLNDRLGPRFILTLCCFFLGLVLNMGGKKSGAQRQSEIKSALPQAPKSIQKSSALTAPSEDVRCVRCGAIVKQARKYCSNCGARMTRQTVSEAPIRPITTLPPRTPTCVRCGATVDASKRFCTSCGAQLTV